MEEGNKTIIQSRIQEAQDLYERTESLVQINGFKKMLKKIKAELNFLKQLQNSNNFRPEHLQSSNLNNLSSIVEVATNYQGKVKSFYQPFNFQNAAVSYRQYIDIVADNGKTWIKVIARNPYALERICSGDSEYGVKTVIDQASDLLLLSRENRHHFTPPVVVMHFVCGITKNLESKLTKLGVVVRGDVLKSQLNIDDNEEEIEQSIKRKEFEEPQVNENHLNLDVSTLIAYVSSLTNGGSHHYFREAILNEEAEAERLNPVKAILDNVFEGKVLCCCDTAISDFKRIIHCVGGENEIKRSEEFLSRIRVIPDHISEAASKLPIGGRIKERSQIVFGTGDNIKAVTVTANSSFLRAASVKGVKFAVFEHEARALSERKEIKNS